MLSLHFLCDHAYTSELSLEGHSLSGPGPVLSSTACSPSHYFTHWPQISPSPAHSSLSSAHTWHGPCCLESAWPLPSTSLCSWPHFAGQGLSLPQDLVQIPSLGTSSFFSCSTHTITFSCMCLSDPFLPCLPLAEFLAPGKAETVPSFV